MKVIQVQGISRLE